MCFVKVLWVHGNCVSLKIQEFSGRRGDSQLWDPGNPGSSPRVGPSRVVSELWEIEVRESPLAREARQGHLGKGQLAL